MNTGMLWFDNDPKTALVVKIERAAEYYLKKYGRKPNLCLIHPTALGTITNVGETNENFEKDKATGPIDKNIGVTVRPYRPVLPGHLWLGVEEND